MVNTFESQKTKFKPIHFIVIFFILIVIIFVVISLETIFHKNPFGEELKIDNFSKYYKKVPEETRDSVFASLYNTASLNTTDTPPTSGAIIRPDSTSETYNQSTEIYSSDFIVDIESIQQSFRVYMEWSKKSDNPNLTGYTVTISCLTGSSSAYGATKCVDMFDNNSSDKIPALYPIVYDLPIEVSEYNSNYTVYTHYTITYNIEDDNKIIVYITDYTGGNYQNALKKIRDLGYAPDLYNIQYIDQSNEEIPARPADYDF